MSTFTLRQAAGLPTRPDAADQHTLVVIDAQREYEPSGRLRLERIGPALDRIGQLLDHARRVGMPVVHVVHDGPAGGAFDPADGGRISAQAAPRGDEPIVHKTLPNAFAGTELDQQIADDAHLLLVGFMTHMCVSATARSALDRGIATTVVSDATATRSLPSADGDGVVTAADVHRAALAALADRFSVVTDTASILGLTDH